MLRISDEEYRRRLANLQQLVRDAELDAFLVTCFENIFYLTGAGFEPLERPFFLVVAADEPPALLTPRLDFEHMRKARVVEDDRRHTYWEYPAPNGRGWPDRLRGLLSGRTAIGVEPSLPQELAWELQDYSLRL